MKRIDAHQHFWKFDPVKDSWIGEEMKCIRKDFFPKDFAPVLQKNCFDGSVAVQASQSEEETKFLVLLAERNKFIKGVVGWVDLQRADIRERLEYYRQFPVVKGFRHVLQGESQRDLMLQPDFKRGIAELHAFNFTYDLLIFPDQLLFAAQLVASFPNQRFVVDHMAKPFMKRKEINTWKSDIERMAAHPNTYCKISGMATEIDWKNWKREYFLPYIDIVVNAFGTDRIMFGSDWPVCLAAVPFEEVLQIANDYFRSFSESDQEKFFGLNAIRFYNL